MLSPKPLEGEEKLPSILEEARAAGVTPWVVTAFEDEREVSPADEAAIRAALEAVGISFSFEIANGRARPAGVTYSPRDRNEGH
jgi:hypothetical protein